MKAVSKMVHKAEKETKGQKAMRKTMTKLTQTPTPKAQAVQASAKQTRAIVNGQLPMFTIGASKGFADKDKMADHLNDWLLMFNGVERLAKSGKSAGKTFLVMDVYDENGKEFQMGVSGVMKEYVDAVELPYAVKIIRPGAAFIPSDDEIPSLIIALFNSWIEKNAARIGAIKSNVGDGQVNI
jgi:hypothetical protein